MIIKLSETTKGKDKYLRMNTVGYGVIILSVFFILLGILCWLFFGAYNITVNGYADVVYGRETFCAVEVEDIDKVKVGMDINIGNDRGKVTFVEKQYYTYERFGVIYGPIIKKFNLSPNKSYYFVYADISTSTTGIKPFSIVVDTVTP